MLHIEIRDCTFFSLKDLNSNSLTLLCSVLKWTFSYWNSWSFTVWLFPSTYKCRMACPQPETS